MRKEFTTHLLNERGLLVATKLGVLFSDLLDNIEAIVPEGRERSIVITKLQEASFYAKRAIACDPQNGHASTPDQHVHANPDTALAP